MSKPRLFDISCYGTSLTTNYFAREWVYRLPGMIAPGCPRPVRTYSVGQGGQSSVWGLSQAGLERMLNMRAQAHTVEFSINDAIASNNITLQQSYDNHKGIYQAIRNAIGEETLVFFMTMNPVSEAGQGARPQLPAYYQKVRDLVADLNDEGDPNVFLIDNNPLWTDPLPASDSDDGLHPNLAAVNRILLPSVADAIRPHIV